MGNDIQTSIVVDLKGNLARQNKRNEESIKRFSKKSGQHLNKLNRKVKRVGSTFGSMGKRYLGVAAAGAAALGTTKKLLGLQERYERLGVQANISPEKAIALRRKVYAEAQAPDVRVDAAEILSAIEAIVEKTGDLKFAEKNIRNIALAIKATSSAGKDIGNITAEFQKMGIMDPSKVLEALDLLTVQGKAGAFTLQNLAGLGSRTITAYTASGRGGLGSIREMGAVLQMIRQGTGSSEMAATAFEAVLRTLGDAKKVKSLQNSGIKVFDEKALKEGKEVLRPLNELMKEIVKATGGKKTLLSRVFDAEAIRAFNAMSSEYQRTNNFSSLDKFMNIQADGKIITADSARLAKTGSSRLTSMNTTITDRIDAAVNNVLSDSFGKALMGETKRNSTGPFGGMLPPSKNNNPTEELGKVIAREINNKEATIKLEVESKDARVKTKAVKTEGMDIEMDSALDVGGAL